MQRKNVALLKQEFIGKQVSVEYKDIAGTIIDETKNSFTIQTLKGKKTILKTNNSFLIKIHEDKIKIEGKQIKQRPEDRIKLKKWK